MHLISCPRCGSSPRTKNEVNVPGTFEQFRARLAERIADQELALLEVSDVVFCNSCKEFFIAVYYKGR